MPITKISSAYNTKILIVNVNNLRWLKKIKFWVCQTLIMKKKLLKSVQMLHLQTMRLGVLKLHWKSAESKKFSGELGSSKNAKLKCRKFSKLQKREIKMQRKISVLQYLYYFQSLWPGHPLAFFGDLLYPKADCICDPKTWILSYVKDRCSTVLTFRYLSWHWPIYQVALVSLPALVWRENLGSV